MKHLILILLLASCNQYKEETQYAICQPYDSMNCELVQESEWNLYREQYQICEIEKNEFDCLNIYNFKGE